VGKQCCRLQIHMHPAILVIVGVHHDNVPSSWMNAGILKVLANRAQTVAPLGQDDANNVELVI
jgi:hypothetical protein